MTIRDQSAIAMLVARRGPGLAHVAFATRDIDAILPKLAADDWRMIDLEGRPGGRGSLIGFVPPSNFGGGLLRHVVAPQGDGGYEETYGSGRQGGALRCANPSWIFSTASLATRVYGQCSLPALVSDAFARV